MSASLSIIIPVWNGLHLVQKNLPSVIKSASRLSCPWEIIVVDDASSDCIAKFLAENFPAVGVLRHERNQGFGAAIKTGVVNAKYEWLYFLNSDVYLEEEALIALLPHFSSENVFSVSSADINQEKIKLPAFTDRCGLLGVGYVEASEIQSAVDIAFSTGGHSAFNSAKFRELGGFDELFAPFYWEDIDLCARALARKWRIILEPKSRVRHQAGSSVSRRYRKNKIEQLRASHRWLFSLRHSFSLCFGSWMQLVAAHGCAAFSSFLVGLKRRRLVRRDPGADKSVFINNSVASVKKRLGLAWNIIYVSATGDIAGGGEISLLTLLGSIDRKSVRPVLVCPSEGELVNRAREIGIDVRIMRLPASIVGFFNGSVMRIVGFLRDVKADAVHVNSSGRYLVLFGFACRLLGVPILWHVRVASREIFTDWLGAALSKRLVVTSDFVASRFRSDTLKERIVKVPNAVDARRFYPRSDAASWRLKNNIPEKAKVVSVIGRLDAWKRFDIALRAFAGAKAKCTDLHLVILGDGPKQGYLRNLVDSVGISGAVSFLGWQDDSASAMSASDFILHPTPKEHFGRIFIEAMACGKPVIASKSGAAPEIIDDGKTGFLIPPKDEKAFADAIVRLASDEGLRFSMGNASLEKVRKCYFAQHISDDMLKAYEDVLLA